MKGRDTTATETRRGEVFTAVCPLCEDAVGLVRSRACPNCEVQVYHRGKAARQMNARRGPPATVSRRFRRLRCRAQCWTAIAGVQSMPLCSGLQAAAKSKQEDEMEDRRTTRLLTTGLIGSVIVAICCVTPILVVLLGAIGLGAMTGYVDGVLLPALAGFLGLTAYGVYRRKQATAGTCCASSEPHDQER